MTADFLTPRLVDAVSIGMADNTKCNQVLFGVVAGVAAELLVVDLEVGHCAARLASPTVSA
jgi:hypothetical protein